MQIRQLFTRSHCRLASSGLLWWGAVWSVASLLFFSWPSRLLSGPWLERLFGAQHSFDIFILQQRLEQAKQSGLLGLLTLIFLLRLLLTPLIEAFIYQRLLRSHQSRFAPAGFYGLYLLEFLALALAGWLFLLFLWPRLLLLPRLLPLTLPLIAVLAWLVGVYLSWQRARLAIGQASVPKLPPASQWLSLALGQAALTLAFGLLLVLLYRASSGVSGIALAVTLAVAAVVRTYGRLWKIAVALEAWSATLGG